MFFTLLYVPFIVLACYYFPIAIVGLSLVIVGSIWSSVLIFRQSERKEYISPLIVILLGGAAWISENFMALKLYPLLLSVLFLLYFIISVLTRNYLLIEWVEKFKKRPLQSSERHDVILSHWFWIGVLGINTSLHLYFVLKDNTFLWALYSFAGWYLLFGIAMALQLLFAYRIQIAQGIRNIWGYGLFIGVILVGFIPAITAYFLKRILREPKSHIIFQRITAKMFRIFFRYAPGIGKIDFQISPKYHQSTPYIYVASHESWLDYPLIASFITDLYHLTNKKSPFIFFLRSIASLLGVVDGVGVNVLHTLLQKLRRNSNVLIFAEGSRSTEGSLLPFRKGAFSLALESGVHIVPIVISGTRHLIPKGTLSWQNVKEATIKVQIMDPMKPLQGEDVQQYKERVWEKMREVKKAIEIS